MTRPVRGSTLLVVPTVVVLCAVLLGGAVRLGAAAADRARADSVADMAALAAVHAGARGAARVAEGNDAALVSHDHRDGTDVVAVRHRGVLARAAAEPTP